MLDKIKSLPESKKLRQLGEQLEADQATPWHETRWEYEKLRTIATLWEQAGREEIQIKETHKHPRYTDKVNFLQASIHALPKIQAKMTKIDHKGITKIVTIRDQHLT